jgi:hypothetical protein
VIVARHLGEAGFAFYAKAVHRLGVLSYSELLDWLQLHGGVLRASGPPLDDGETFDEEAFSGLRELLR